MSFPPGVLVNVNGSDSMWGMNGSFANDGEPLPFNKYGPAPLPAIHSTQTPQPNEYNQIVPIGGRRSQLSNITAIPAYAGDYAENRLRQVEDRLNMSEQSCRALLEEVVRLRGELKQSHNRTEEAIQGERQSRQTLAENIRASNDLIGQLGARLKRAEERVSDERTAVGALVNHTKQVEQAVLGSQQELVARRDQQLSKIAELRNDLDEANRLREQVERATTTLVDEVRTIKGKVETHHLESNSIVHDVKERTKRLEEDNRTLMDSQRKLHESQHSSEQATSLLRTQLDARLGEVRDVLMDLRNRVTTEETERRQQEQNFFLKLNDVQAQVHEQSRKRDETVHTIDVVQREREHAADNERLKMQGKIAEIAEEVSRKILSKEIRLREEAQQKFGNIEKYLHAEQAARIAHEQAMREENEKRWSALQKLTEEEVLHVREGQKLERHKNVGGMSKVNEYMDKLEKMQHETKKQLEAVMKAEIKSRQNQDKQIEDKIEDVQEKLGVAISTLQQAIGGINEQVSSATQQYQGKVQQMIEEQGQGGLRGLADLDARVMALQSKVGSQEEGLQQTISKAISEAMDDKAAKTLLDTQGEKIEQIDDWRDSADKKLKQIKERMDELGPEIREMNRTNESLQEDMKGIIDSESKDRIRDVQMVRQDLQVKYNQLVQDLEEVKRTGGAGGGGGEVAVPVIPVSQKEKLAQGKGGGKVDEATKARIDDMEETINKQRKKFEELKEQIGKVESSIQTVRVHLGRKIDTETKARREETQDMQGLFEELQSRLAPLLDDNKASEDRQTPSNKERGQGSGRASKKGSGKGRPAAQGTNQNTFHHQANQPTEKIKKEIADIVGGGTRVGASGTAGGGTKSPVKQSVDDGGDTGRGGSKSKQDDDQPQPSTSRRSGLNQSQRGKGPTGARSRGPPGSKVSNKTPLRTPRNKGPAMFVKDADGPNDVQSTPGINRYSIYNAYWWLKTMKTLRRKLPAKQRPSRRTSVAPTSRRASVAGHSRAGQPMSDRQSLRSGTITGLDEGSSNAVDDGPAK